MKPIFKFGIFATLGFLGIFVYLYRNTKKFRHSIVAAVVSVAVSLSGSTPVEAANNEAEAFAGRSSVPMSRPQSTISSTSSSSSGSGKPDDFSSNSEEDAVPIFPRRESVKQTEERVANIERLIRKLDEDSESEDEDSESEDEDECLVDSNKGLFKELPESQNFEYDMTKGKTLKKASQNVWKNPTAKKEVLRMLKRFDNKDSNLEEKPLKGFKHLTELKNSGAGARIFVYRGKNEPPKVIGFCMRKELTKTLKKLKTSKEKFN